MIIYFLTTCCILKGELLIVLCVCVDFSLFFSLSSFLHFNISIQFFMIFIAISILLLIPDFECHINRSLIFIIIRAIHIDSMAKSTTSTPFNIILDCTIGEVNKTKQKRAKYFHNFSFQLQSDLLILFSVLLYLYPNKML